MTFSLKLALPVLAASLLLPMAAAHAGVVVSDNFEAPGDTIGNAPTGNWTSTSSLTSTIVSDSTTDPSGTQALDQSASTGSQHSTLTFPSVTLNDGDSLTLSFNVRLPDVASVTAGDRKFRFGFYNSSVDEGYIARMDVGNDTSNTTTADIWATHNGGLGVSSSGGGKELHSTSDPLGALNSTDVDNLSLTITRSGTDIAESFTITDLTNAGSVTISGTDTTTTVPSDTGYAFDEVLIGQNGGSAIDYHLDAVSVTSTPAPEPASLGLLGTSALLMLRRRRRA